MLLVSQIPSGARDPFINLEILDCHPEPQAKDLAFRFNRKTAYVTYCHPEEPAVAGDEGPVKSCDVFQGGAPSEKVMNKNHFSGGNIFFKNAGGSVAVNTALSFCCSTFTLSTNAFTSGSPPPCCALDSIAW